MNILDIAKVAEDCGFCGAPLKLTWTMLNQFGEAVAEFAAKEEREACAKVCEGDSFVEQFIGLNEAVRRIRARSNNDSSAT